MKQIIFLITIFIITSFQIISECHGQDYKSKERPKIGLVLSGGGAKGFAHVGVLKVMEAAGLRPDYIAGTSMGSIVGGLYAIGYSADSLEKISKTSDWNYLLADEVPRRNLTLEEKEDHDRFVISFPIKENKIKIPSGVINGQNIENLLNKLCAPVYDTRDFSDFEIPFLCIATDIETGEEIIFREGYLPEVLRASMSIPSIFSPMEINDHLLVDGGVVNNFPVLRLKEMGADIIIGVDVGFQYYEKEELNSIFRIIEQTVFFYGEELNYRNRKYCDYLIEPDLEKYNASSFSSADSIILKGEKEALKYYNQFKMLADSMRMYEPNYKPDQEIEEIDSLTIMEISVRGLDEVSGRLLTGKLQLEVFDKVTPGDIEEAINRVYSSLYFEKVSYEIQPLEEGIRLNINVKEAKGGQFRVGLHYDSYYKSSILINTTFRNVLFDGSKFSASLALGENPYFRINYFKNNGWKPGFGIDFQSNKLDVFLYESGEKISSLAYSESITKLYLQSIFWNSYSIGGGIEYEAARLKPKIDPGLGLEEETNTYINYFGKIEMDSYNNAFYPKRGLRLDAKLKLITSDGTEPVVFIVGRLNNAISIGKKFTYINHIYGGAVDGKEIPYQYFFYTGGLNNSFRNGFISFVGMDFMEKVNSNALVWAGDLQFEVFPNIYAIMKGSIGNLTDDFANLLKTDNLLGGYGITLGYDSFIGPIEVSATKAVNEPGILGFVNIGFWF